MVEAAGIEPASEDFRRKASTCLSSCLFLAWQPLKRKDAEKPALIRIHRPHSRRIRVCYPARRRFSSAAGKHRRNGCPNQAAIGSCSALI